MALEKMENIKEVDSLGRTKDDIAGLFPNRDVSSLRLVNSGGNKHWKFGEEPIDYLLDSEKKEKEEVIFEQEVFEVAKKYDVHRDLLKKDKSEWLACDMPIEKYVMEREKIAHEFGVDVKYLSKRDGEWHVLYHTKEIPIAEWEQKKKEVVQDINGKTGEQILKENEIGIEHLRELVLVDDEWRMYRLGKFYTLEKWKEEIRNDKLYNEKTGKDWWNN